MIKLTSLFLVLFTTAFGALFLFFLSNKKYINRLFLGYFFLISFLVFLGNTVAFYNFYKVDRFYDFIFLTALLSFYPSYYLYLFSAFNFKIISSKWFYHFIPALIFGITMLIISIFSSNEDFKLYLNHNIHGTALSSSNASLLDFVYNWARYVHLAQIVVYTFLAIRIIIIGKKAIYNTFSNLTKLQITNFFIVTSSFILLMSIPGFYITYMGRQPFSEEEISLFYLAIIFTLLYLILALIGLKQQPVEEHLIHKNKPISKNLSELELKLTNYFNKNEAWKKSDLTIWDVSKSLGTNRSYISQIINNKHQCNFNAFVNYYRINYAKKILSNNKNLTLVEVSEKSGFGSLNSFIRIFKKFTKQTPSAFRKENT